MENKINANRPAHYSNAIAGDFSGAGKPQNIEQAAEQFEALFLKLMLKQMRAAADSLKSDDSPFNSKEQRIARDWHDDVLATHLAAGKSMGIAELLVNQLDQKK